MKQDKRYIKTEKLIRTEFLSLLKNNLYDDITIEKLCENAVISKNTFYAHYKNKNDLLEKLEDEHIDKMISFFKQNHSSVATNGLDALEKDIDHTYDYLRNNIEEFEIFFKNNHIVNFSAKFETKMRSYTLTWSQMLVGTNISEAKDVIMFDFIASGLAATMKDYIMFRKIISHEEYKSIVKQICLSPMKSFTDSIYKIHK